jgi:serine phosphatase RsbU (regulator of sigma subunit)
MGRKMGVSDAVQKKTVLIVDDAPANIQIVHSILKDEYRVRVATSGRKAMELVNAKPRPDLVLLDVMMPEMDGYEVCGRLKASKETRDIPVIFLTGMTDADDETKGFQAGAVDYIHKPFSPAVVKARVQTHLVLRDAREQLARQLLSINQELELARQIQLSILPREIPKMAGFEISSRYLPMGSVAGDFYDFLVLDDKHVGILIADVSGHGLAAALIASMLQVALSAQLPNAASPARVLSGLNRALCGKFQCHFVTAAYLFVDAEKNAMAFAGAGHPPMLLWEGSRGSVREVLKNGLVLGQFPQELYGSVDLEIGRGDRCVLYTDGILEARNRSGEIFGADRMRIFLESNHGLSAGNLADLLLGELSRWTERPMHEGQEDDLTLLAIAF